VAATKQASGDVIGPYRLEDYLGGGAFGSVWRAVEISSGENVALKLLGAIDRVEIRGEIELLAATASSTSEHVVRVLGGDTLPVPYIAMEYVDGSDLAESLTERGRLPVEEVVVIGTALADALVALERVEIVHRDVKPGNVLLAKNGDIKLADFGIAKIAGYATVTSTRQAPMTMAYAAPEVWDGHATKSSDFYAFGCLLFQCLAGRPPFDGGVGELYKAHAERLPNLDGLPTNTPPSLRDIISRCLAKDPMARPAMAAELYGSMRRASVELSETTNAVTTSSEPRKFGPWLRREPDPSRPWTWYCVHEESGDEAIVEIYGFATAAEGQVLEDAYEKNPGVVPFGAERILGRNRLLLRPGEGWLTPAPGDSLFWVAREKLVDESLPGLTRSQVAESAASLAQLKETASRLQLPLEISSRTLVWTADGVRVIRPGLPTVNQSADDAAAIAWLAAGTEPEIGTKAKAAGTLAGVAAVLAPPVPDVGVALPATDATSLGPGGLSPDSTMVTTMGRMDRVEAAPQEVPEPEFVEAVAAPVAVADPPPPPPKRRFGLIPLVATGGAAAGLLLGAFALFTNGGGESLPPTPTPVAEAFEIKAIDCSPSTADIGAPIACDAVVGAKTDQTTFAWEADGGTPPSGSESKFATSFATDGPRKRIFLKACKGESCVEKSAFVSVNDPSIGPPPETAFTCAPNPVRSGEPISCAALAAGEGLKWTWDAPGGSNPTGAEKTFATTFSGTKVNEVTLTICRVVGEKQACATGKQTILLLEDATQAPPTATPKPGGGNTNTGPTPVPVPIVASVLCTPQTPKVNEPVTCSASITGSVEKRTWLASGGSPASGNGTTWVGTFTVAGPKTILLDACNGAGCSSQSGNVAVTDLPAPTFELLCRPGVIRIAAPITCTTNVNSGKVTSWSWNAPSSAPATGTADSFIGNYNTYGTKSISVVACDGSACSTQGANFRVLAPWEPDGNEQPGPAPTNPPEQPTPTPTSVATNTPVPNAPPTNTPTITPTPIPGSTNTPTPTSTPVLPTNTPTATPVVPIPAAPSALSPFAYNCGKIELSWVDNSNNEAGFRLYYNGVLRGTVGPNVTAFNDDVQLAVGANVTWEVRAFTTGGESAGASNSFFAPGCASPTNLTVFAYGCGIAEPSWTDVLVGIVYKGQPINESGFRIYLNGVLKGQVAPDVTTYHATGVPTNQFVTFEVRAFYGGLESSAASNNYFQPPPVNCP